MASLERRSLAIAAACLWAAAAVARAQPPVEPTMPEPTMPDPTASSPTSSEPAVSDDDASPERIEARRRYQQGVVFFRAERYREAIAEFEAAYRAWDNPLILYSLGQSYERLLSVPRAIDAYSRFLDRVGADDPRRTEVVAKIDTLRLLLATLRIECNVPARVWIDDEDVGAAPGDIALAVGRWNVEIRAEGYEPHREAISLAARATETLSVTLAPIVQTRVVERQGGLPPGVFIGVGAAAVVAAGVAIGLGAHTLELADAYEHAMVRLGGAQAEGRSWSTATDIVGIGAGLLAVTAFVLALLTDWDGDATPEATTTSVLVTPNGAMLAVGRTF